MLLALSFYLLIFSTLIDSGKVMQLIGVAFFLLFAISIRENNSVRMPGLGKRLDWMTVVICYLLPITSMSVLLFNGQFDLVPQSILFMTVSLAARRIAINKTLIEVTNILIFSSALMAITLLFFEFEPLNESLNLFTLTTGSRIRFSPFDSHPNLIGHIFGITSVVSFVYCFNHFCKKDYFFYMALFSTACSFIFISAASSRGGAFSAFISISFFLYLKWISNISNAKKITASIVILIMVAFGISYFLAKGDEGYLSELFELNSQFRGFDSGLTGRADNWPVIVSMVFDDLPSIFFGHGIRSWDDDLFNMATDSFYVNQLWESGLFITLFLIFLMMRQLYSAISMTFTEPIQLIFVVLIFILIESVVARYLLGIGNPASIYLLITYFYNFKRNEFKPK